MPRFIHIGTPSPDISYKDGARAVANGTASPTVNYPSTVADEIMLAFYVTNSASNASGTPPSGWTKVEEADGTDESAGVFWRRATGSEPASETWTNIFDASESSLWIVLTYEGCITSGSPIDVSANDTSGFGSSKSIGATTVTNRCMALGMFGIDPGGTILATYTGGSTKRIDSDTTPSGQDGTLNYMTIGEKIVAPAGAYTIDCTLDTSETASEVTLSLKPA